MAHRKKADDAEFDSERCPIFNSSYCCITVYDMGFQSWVVLRTKPFLFLIKKPGMTFNRMNFPSLLPIIGE